MVRTCSTPAPGRYKLHVRGHQPGAEGGISHIRGSPFTIECSDPWQPRVLAGAAPLRRPGATLASVGSDLVLFGGDKSLAAVCHAPVPADELDEQRTWQWFPTDESERPVARKGHAAAVVPGTAKLLVCGGIGLEGEPTELIDVRTLVCHGSSWGWQAAGAAPTLHERPDGSKAPTERSGHCAVALGSDTLLVFGGESQGQLLQEMCLLDSTNKVRGAGWGKAGRASGGRELALRCSMYMCMLTGRLRVAELSVLVAPLPGRPHASVSALAP